MPGLEPGIHGFAVGEVDGRVKPGHDVEGEVGERGAAKP
jgi:hypothetical protein